MAVTRHAGSARPPLISIVTPTVPERGSMLAELEASVRGQTFARWEHLVSPDPAFRGCAVTVNEAAGEARAGWLFLIADDDLLLPHCLEQLYRARIGADIVYSQPVVEGEHPAQFHGEPPGIPAVALIRRRFWEQLGGYDATLAHCEDCDFYQRALDVGGVFRRVAGPGWVYRIGHPLGNKSRGKIWKC